jgi:hypothetical protein
MSFETHDWYQRRAQHPYGYCKARRCGEGVHLLTTVVERNGAGLPHPTTVVRDRGMLEFRAVNERRRTCTVWVKPFIQNNRVEWTEPNQARQLMLWGRTETGYYETGGSFGFRVVLDGTEELHTAIARHPIEQPGGPNDVPAQSRFDARRSERPGPGFDVFICHAGADKDQVRRFADQCKVHDVNYWLDEEQISLGDPVTQRIQDGLDTSRIIIVCVSQNLVRSSWARTEYTAILARVCGPQPSSNRRQVIPLVLEDVPESSYPSLLYDRSSADIRDPKSMEALFKVLKGR